MIRQLLTESVLLASLGGIVGAALAYWGSNALVAAIARGFNDLTIDASPNLTILGFTAAVSIGTGILFGLAPALGATRPAVAPALSSRGAIDSGGHRGRAAFGGRSLVVVQVALSLLLLVGAALLVRTLVNVQRVDLGINRANVLLFSIAPGTAGYEGDRVVALYDRIFDELNRLPGVRSASLSRLPVIARSRDTTNLEIQGGEGSSMKIGERISVWTNKVGPRFPETMGLRIVAGRDFNEGDTPTSPIVVLINETLARRFFGTPNPVGRQFNFEGRSPDRWTVAGVVSDAKYSTPREPVPPTVYFLYRRHPRGLGEMTFEIRTQGDPAGIVASVRRVMRNIDPNLPLIGVKTQAAQIDQTVFAERIFAQLSALSAIVAVLLACIGVYGLLAYSVARRTAEIGIRVALGARRGDVVWMILREALMLAGAGIAIGVPASLAATRALKAMLFGLEPHDPATLAGAVVVLAVVAAAAGFIPAQRASRVEPSVALRQE